METEKILFNATVCLPIKGDKVLLAIKTRKIGAGCWNGYGGGIEEGENPKTSVIRELKEESGLIASIDDLEKIAVVDFHNEKSDGSTYICRVHFFLLENWTGELIETEEMITPTFFSINNLPFDKMMPADREYFPFILNKKKIYVKSYYSPFQKELKGKVEIEEVEELPEN
ncbi:MAG: NUDIX domain-containing protein [Candidatus Paceibacterota bacterium]|jgi:8-oxo-dGTP diphosphatase